MKLMTMITRFLGNSAKSSAANPTRRSINNEVVPVDERFEYASSLLEKGPQGYFIEPEGSFDLEIVGESFYQDSLLEIAGPKTEKGTNFRCLAQLVCDHDNNNDRNAVSVQIGGKVVGYLARTDAGAWRKMLKSQGAGTSTVLVCAEIVGGWKKNKGKGPEEGSFGVRLDVPVA